MFTYKMDFEVILNEYCQQSTVRYNGGNHNYVKL